MADVEFETIVAEEVKFGNNNFLEIARKKAISNDSENEFISISRGFMARNDEKRFRKSIAFPMDPAVINSVIAALQKVSEGMSEQPQATKKKSRDSEEEQEEEAEIQDEETSEEDE